MNKEQRLTIQGTNKDGSRLYGTFRVDGKPLLKGAYDFNSERFFIIRYISKNCKGLSHNDIRTLLQDTLATDYDWSL
jgi:hypothetical protein